METPFPQPVQSPEEEMGLQVSDAVVDFGSAVESATPIEPDPPEADIPNIEDLPDLVDPSSGRLKAAQKAYVDPFFGYGPNPVTEDQYTKFPASVKSGKLEVGMYDLSDEDSFRNYQVMMQESDSREQSPRVKLEMYEKIETPNGWKVLVHYRRLWYKQITKS